MLYNFVPDSYHTGVAAEALRAKIGNFAPTRSFDPKFQVQGVAPHQSFLHS